MSFKQTHWLIDLKKAWKSFIDWNVENSKEKIDYWRIDKVLTFYYDWLIDIQNRKINYWLSFSQTHDHFRWFTMRQMKVKYIHRFQRKNFFVCFAKKFDRLFRHENFTFWRFCFVYSRISSSNSLFIETNRLIVLRACLINKSK